MLVRNQKNVKSSQKDLTKIEYMVTFSMVSSNDCYRE